MNYHKWSTAMMYKLSFIRAWRIVTGEEQPPSEPSTNTRTAEHHRYEDKWDNYNARCDLAAATIYQSCSATIQAYIAGNRDPQAIWQILKSKVDTASNANRPILL
jgi:GH15 family glucan-1,4-alpha-glucosidase